jgi:small subunit ribosomal protein S2
MVDFKELISVGIHFGHQTARWNPKMAPYIWGFRKGIHLVDVSKTAHYLEKAAKFLEAVASEGKPILWVGTKKAAQKAIEKWGNDLKMPNVTHRWIGGTLTNFPQVKKSVTKLLHFEDILDRAANFPYTKKEFLNFQKMADRLNRNVGGIRNLKWPIGAIVIIDVRKEKTVLNEAQVAGIPVVALVDTNSDPTGVSYVVPGNDDSPKAVNFIIDYLGEAVKRGVASVVKKEKAPKKDVQQVEALKAKVAEPKKIVVKKEEKVAEKVSAKEVKDVKVVQSVVKKEDKVASKKEASEKTEK